MVIVKLFLIDFLSAVLSLLLFYNNICQQLCSVILISVTENQSDQIQIEW